MANNPLLFNAALAGAFGGINTSRWLISSNAADYTTGRNSAISFAQAVDAAIPTNLLTSQQDAALLTSICQQVLSGKGETGEPVAAAIAAAYNLARSSLEVVALGPVRQWATIGEPGPLVSNTGALVSLLPAAGLLPASAASFPAGYFNTVGQTLAIEAAGRLSSNGGAPGAVQFFLKFGAASFPAQTQALSLNTTAKVDIGFNLRWEMSLRAVGASGVFLHGAFLISESMVGAPLPSVAGVGVFNVPNGTPANGGTFNTNIAQAIDFQVLFSSAQVGNAAQLSMFRILA